VKQLGIDLSVMRNDGVSVGLGYLDVSGSLARAVRTIQELERDDCILINCIDRYGDTVLNSLMAERLLLELTHSASVAMNADERESLALLSEKAHRVANDVGLRVILRGD
jgi:hypothetical protein